MHPLTKYLLAAWSLLLIEVYADDFPSDYFHHKSVSRVTLFSCDQPEYDFNFARKMSALGISVSVHHPNSASYNASAAIERNDNWKFGMFLDTRCQAEEISRNIFTQTSNSRLYDGIHIWLILGWSLDNVTQLLDDESYSTLTDLAIATLAGDRYDIYDVYNPSKFHGGNLRISDLGSWDPVTGLNIILKESKFTRRSNLQGMTVRAVAVAKYLKPSETIEDHLLDYTRKSEDVASKYGYSILRHVGDLYNFTMKLTSHEEWLATINGTEVGTFVMMSQGEADIQVSPASPMARYLTKPYGHLLMHGYPYRTFFLFRSSEGETLKWFELMTPFAVNSWCAIFATAIFSILIITTIQMTEYGEGWFAESGHAIFATIGALCQQGLVFVPNRLAGRVAFLFILFLGVLLSNYYGASVVSSRLNEPTNKMNDSLYMLAKKHITLKSEPYRYIDLNLGVRAWSEWEAKYFYEEVWNKLPNTKYISTEEGLPKMGKNYAFHTSAEVAYPYVEANWDDKAICDMTEVHIITPRILSFWERVNSPFTELMRVGLAKTADTGLRTRTIKRWKPKIPYCSPDARSLESITIFDIAPALMVVLGGTVLAILVYYIEVMIYKFCPDTSKRDVKLKKPRIVGKKTLQRT